MALSENRIPLNPLGHHYLFLVYQMFRHTQTISYIYIYTHTYMYTLMFIGEYHILNATLLVLVLHHRMYIYIYLHIHYHVVFMLNG